MSSMSNSNGQHFFSLRNRNAEQRAARRMDMHLNQSTRISAVTQMMSVRNSSELFPFRNNNAVQLQQRSVALRRMPNQLIRNSDNMRNMSFRNSSNPRFHSLMGIPHSLQVRSLPTFDETEDYGVFNVLPVNIRRTVSIGITSTKIPQLPSYKFDHETHNGETTCSICLGDFETGETLRVLPCKHEFHAECIDTWFKEKITCPLCRVKI